jgi:hypothetical protein
MKIVVVNQTPGNHKTCLKTLRKTIANILSYFMAASVTKSNSFMTLTPVGHRVVPAGSVADVIDLSDSQLDRKALRRDGRDVLESDGRVREQNLKKSGTFVI